MNRILIILSLYTALICACQQPDETQALSVASESDHLHRAIKNLTDVIVHDIYSPPVASRIYAYPAIAAYECLVQKSEHSEYKSLSGQLNELDNITRADTSVSICYELAALQAYATVAKPLIASKDRIQAELDSYINILDSLGLSNETKDRSISLGNAVAADILGWADKDNYKESRTFSKFSITDDVKVWKPTPPGYGEAIEPHWNTMRPMVLKSLEDFIPPPPTPYSLNASSQFYKELTEVYDAVKNADDEQTEIAQFWDCNPYMLNVVGHAMFATKKITPGGHWVGITRKACQHVDASFMKSLSAYTLTKIALFDGFISCWDEKYRSQLVRPETVINEHLDADWMPILQTPPFPEHTSGHSVISRAAAVVLTSIFGDNFAYQDDVELEFGLPMREYDSFLQASEEAAISRLYGGIHYRPAIEYGIDQGQKVGEYVVANVALKEG